MSSEQIYMIKRLKDELNIEVSSRFEDGNDIKCVGFSTSTNEDIFYNFVIKICFNPNRFLLCISERFNGNHKTICGINFKREVEASEIFTTESELFNKLKELKIYMDKNNTPFTY